MSAPELMNALLEHYAHRPLEPGSPPRLGARELLEALARSGLPAGGEDLARRLIFDHLEMVQDQLDPVMGAHLEALLDPTAGPAATARPSSALDARVLDAVRREAPPPLLVAPARPHAPPPHRGFLGLAQLAAATAVAFVVMAVTVTSGGRPAAPPTDPSPLTPGSLEIRLDRGLGATYHPGQEVFIQLAPSRAGHLALLVLNPLGRAGVSLTDQQVAAGQVVVSRLGISGNEGTAALVGVLSADALMGLPAALGRLPIPTDTSTVIKTVEELAARQHTRAVCVVAPLSVTK